MTNTFPPSRYYLFALRCYPTNTPRVFHVEATWKRLFPRRFNVEYTWCVCRVAISKTLRSEENQLLMVNKKVSFAVWLLPYLLLKFKSFESVLLKCRLRKILIELGNFGRKHWGKTNPLSKLKSFLYCKEQRFERTA